MLSSHCESVWVKHKGNEKERVKTSHEWYKYESEIKEMVSAAIHVRDHVIEEGDSPSKEWKS